MAPGGENLNEIIESYEKLSVVKYYFYKFKKWIGYN